MITPTLRYLLSADPQTLFSTTILEHERFDADRDAGGPLLFLRSIPGDGAPHLLTRLPDGGTPEPAQALPVQAADDRAFRSTLTLLDDGAILVVASDGVYFGDGLAGRVFEADGTPRTARFDLHDAPTGGAPAHQVAALPGGGFVATWFEVDYSTISEPQDIVARVFSGDGTALGPAIIVATAPAHNNTLGPSHPSVAALEGGGFAVAWFHPREGAASIRFFAADGTAQGDAIALGAMTQRNSIDSTGFYRPALVPLDDGGVAAFWIDDRGLLVGRLLDADGTPGAVFDIGRFGGNLSVRKGADGGFVVLHSADLPDDSWYSTQALTFLAPDGTVLERAVTVPGFQSPTSPYNWVEHDLFVLDDGALQAVYAAQTGAGIDVRAATLVPRAFADLTDGHDAHTMAGPGAVDALDGRDTVNGSDGGDIILSGAGNDSVAAGSGDDGVDGGAGNDTLDGDGGSDLLIGRAGDDILRGGQGFDTLYGGQGRDTLNGGDQDDLIFGGDGPDDLGDVIYAGTGNDTADGGHGNDHIFGMGGNDSLLGGFGADTLEGQGGNDTITGGAFSDLVFGGDGDDWLNGGFGHDRVAGGAGADLFYHQGAADHGSDWVQDYDAAEGDRLLFGRDFDPSRFGVNIAETPGAGQAGVAEAFVVIKGTGQILWALVDGGAQTSINLQIAGQVYDLLA